MQVDEDDDPIRRIADRIGDGQIEDGEQAVSESSLFSGRLSTPVSEYSRSAYYSLNFSIN